MRITKDFTPNGGKDLPGLMVIVGPTAIGKSRLALEIAPKIDGEIVSADSAQVYRYLNIGTAKPSRLEQKKVRHHLIDIIDPARQFSVAHYQKLARNVIPEIFARGRRPIIVGGTGLYVKSITDGYVFSSSGRNKELRERLNKIAVEKGSKYLHHQLKEKDPESALRIHPRDKRRIIRALEVYYTEGRRISKQWQETREHKPRYRFVMVGLTLNRDELYARINRRTDDMIKNGFIEEVETLLMKYSKEAPGLQILGYRQLVNYLEGHCTLEESMETIKKETRNYAKRQFTWFRRDERIHWFDTRRINIDDFVENINSSLEG
ncbi:MAG: tRNA (adenosine(37)-N6)-dimethylallyltransferase MiaA [Dethiobacteria bacterium]